MTRYSGAFAQFADQVFTGFFDKTQNRSQAQFTPVLGVVALSGALLVAVNRFDRGVDIDPDPGVAQTAQLPDAFAQDAAKLQNRSGLVDARGCPRSARRCWPQGAGRA